MITGLLGWTARQGRYALVAGLLAGALLPGLAEALRFAVAPLIVALLFLAVLRLGPDGLRTGAVRLPAACALTILLQLVLPLAAAAAFALAGVLEHPLARGTVLVLAAAPITGSANLALLMGAEPVAALRQLVLGTALLPLTVVPVFAVMPGFGGVGDVVLAALRLLAIISLAAGAALLLHRVMRFQPAARVLGAIDGLSAILLALVVIGLMSAIGPALHEAPLRLALTLGACFAINLPLQLLVCQLAARRDPKAAPALGIVAGNRNAALFLSILPAATADELMLFIGCFQIPMYLTPLMLGGWYRRAAARGG
ncbi:hypothetical protein ACFQXB_10780 [Plastorhodobacter daqingensis]|uniref:Bile acid:sodium symporter n=1 Tax=Plastorhodobacter daqingensis TaxID=1387281 RepID=A0ABW2UN66_9RHOB